MLFNNLPEIKKFNFLKNQSSQGTPNYMPPEIINNNLKCGTYSDIWSLGCIIYDMVYGSPPFKDKTEYLVFENIINLKFSFPEDILIPEDVKDLIIKILKVNPLERMSGSGNLEDLKNHRFFNDFNADTIKDDLSKNYKPLKKQEFLTANKILTNNFHQNSFIKTKSKIKSKIENSKNSNLKDINVLDDTCDDEETNFNSINNNSNLNCNVNNNSKTKSYFNKIIQNLNPFSCLSKSMNNKDDSQYCSLKVKKINPNKKNSKNIKHIKTEKKSQKKTNLESQINYLDSDFDQECSEEDIPCEDLDEHSDIILPRSGYYIRSSKMSSNKEIVNRLKIIDFGLEDVKNNNQV